jgi:hypothetical protein
MTDLEEKTEFTFAELSDSAKDHARDKARYQDVYDDWWDSVYDDAVTCASLLGIEIGTRSFKTMGGGTGSEPQIHFSGFSSQGDGACYEGSYRYVPEAVKQIKAHAGQDKELHRIAEALTALQVALKLTHNGSGTATATISSGSSNYCHSNTMEFDVSVDGDDSDDCYGPEWPAVEEQLCRLLRDFADWIYRQLEAEHDYLTSDEHIDQYLAELRFDEDGDTI